VLAFGKPGSHHAMVGKNKLGHDAIQVKIVGLSFA
jgi:hypothetical protein